MKRIGILTFHRAINYGAFLQSYSLQQWLDKNLKGVDVEIIDYVPPIENRKIYLNVLRELKKNGVANAIKEIGKILAFHQSYSRLRMSKKLSFRSLDVLYKYLDDYYDAIIVGSDAVLNWNQNGFPSVFYMDHDFHIPLYTYAASAHGLKFYKITSEQKEYCKRCFERFSLLTVRDSCTENFVRYVTSTSTAVHVCDPTFLIDIASLKRNAGDVSKLCKRKYGFNMDEPYLVVMLQNSTLSKIIKDRYGKQFTIVSLFKPNVYADYYLYNLNPFEWTQLLSSAKIVFTQYFHGTLLALRQGVPVLALDASHYNDKYESKLRDLLIRRLNFPEFYIREEELDEIDWTIIFNTVNKAIDGDYKYDIIKAMDQEAQTSDLFLDALRKNREKGKKSE